MNILKVSPVVFIDLYITYKYSTYNALHCFKIAEIQGHSQNATSRTVSKHFKNKCQN